MAAGALRARHLPAIEHLYLEYHLFFLSHFVMVVCIPLLKLYIFLCIAPHFLQVPADEIPIICGSVCQPCRVLMMGFERMV
jgi:hypothetical protein